LANVILPSLGESVTEGIVTRWMKQVGDFVERDEPLYEISTDKVDSEMPSPEAGVLLKIVVAEGDTVDVGGVVAVIGESTGAAPAVAAAPANDAPAASAPTSVAKESPAPVGSLASGVVLSPVVRRVLSDGGIDPRTVNGTGPGGSITRRDAESAVLRGPSGEIAVPLSNSQRRMAEHLSVVANATPQGFVAVEVDASLLDLVDTLGRETRDGLVITDEAVLSLAAVRAMADFPMLNASFDQEFVVQSLSINPGFIRDVDGAGVVVPVVHAAASLALHAFVRRLHDVDERVATRQLTTDDLMGGTFSIQSAPSTTTVLTVPALLPGQTAVVSFGAARHVPVVQIIDGRPSIVVGRRVVVGVTFDHRVVDAALAAAYCERVGEILQSVAIESER
jgi:2-oxoglutarate dehydrogenase E2 component (dihydrolipoamide succinyltransferase)